jgi:hypothetical protein
MWHHGESVGVCGGWLRLCGKGGPYQPPAGRVEVTSLYRRLYLLHSRFSSIWSHPVDRRLPLLDLGAEGGVGGRSRHQLWADLGVGGHGLHLGWSVGGDRGMIFHRKTTKRPDNKARIGICCSHGKVFVWEA